MNEYKYMYIFIMVMDFLMVMFMLVKRFKIELIFVVEGGSLELVMCLLGVEREFFFFNGIVMSGLLVRVIVFFVVRMMRLE